MVAARRFRGWRTRFRELLPNNALHTVVDLWNRSRAGNILSEDMQEVTQCGVHRTVPEAAVAHIEEIVDSMELTARINGFHLEPRCRVCRNDRMRGKVNDLLATGARYAYILRSLAEENAAFDKGDRVTIDSVRNH